MKDNGFDKMYFFPNSKSLPTLFFQEIREAGFEVFGIGILGKIKYEIRDKGNNLSEGVLFIEEHNPRIEYNSDSVLGDIVDCFYSRGEEIPAISG